MARTLAQFISLKRTGLSRMRTNHNHNCRIRPAMLRLEDRTVPAVFTVTNIDDSGAGSLRQAITDSNSTAGTDSIGFSALFATPQTINLLTALPIIADDLELIGPGADLLTVRRNSVDNFGIFQIDDGTGAVKDVQLSGLTISNGLAEYGGGVYCYSEKLTLDSVKVMANSAAGSGGGVFAQSMKSLTLRNCIISGNTSGGDSGGIYLSVNGPNAIIDHCTISNNVAVAVAGGIFGDFTAIESSGTSIIRDCTISNNIALGDGPYGGYGGGLYLNSIFGGGCQIERSSIIGNQSKKGGGGIYLTAFDDSSFSTVWTINNSTISENQVTTAEKGAGISISSYGVQSLWLRNSTVSANSTSSPGAGIAVESDTSQLHLESSIVAGNKGGIGKDIFSATPVTSKNSAVSDSAGFSLIDLGGNIPAGTDLKLGPLANNGGPSLTHMPLAGSPLIDAGFNAGPSGTDQRGPTYARKVGSAVDIGAIEAGSAPGIPTGNLSNFSLSQAGGTSQSFTVLWADDASINIPSLGNNDLRVTGPGTYNQLAVLQSTTVLTPGLVEATYSIPANSTGNPTKWDGHDDGVYTISVEAGSVTDGTNAVVADAIATLTVNVPFPAASAYAPDILSADLGKSINTITIVYMHQLPIIVATLDNLDIRVTGPNGYNQLAVFKGSAPSSDSTTITATYEITAPGGTWDAADIGKYSIAAEPGQVEDVDGIAVPAGIVGSFSVFWPTTFVVNATNDETVDTDGKLSLREAILKANANTADLADTISFDATIFAAPQTIAITSGEMSITDALIINGPGPSLLTLVGAPAASDTNRFFNIQFPAQSVEISGMTLSKGNVTGVEGGGAIQSRVGHLRLYNLVFDHNTATLFGGAVFATPVGGKVSIEDCTFINNACISNDYGDGQGGAVYILEGSANLQRCTFSDNAASGIGGALLNNGATTTIGACTFDHNISGGDGGALWAQSYGPTMNISNSTFFGNTSAKEGGAILYRNAFPSSGVLTIQNSTIAENTSAGLGGGIRCSRMNLSSTVISGNKLSASLDLASDGMVQGNNNLVGLTNVSLVGIGNLVGVDAMLGPLADNGGPTKTCKPLTGSPLINAGNNAAGLAFDQRGTGFLRVIDGKADIGAYEEQTAPPPRVINLLVNNGAIQRSRLTTIAITFNQQVNLPANPADAFQLKRQGDNALVGLTAGVINGPNTVVTLTFSGVLSEFGSLADGRYTLTIDASKASNSNGQLDGNGDGTAGDNYELIGDPATNKLFRFFGDADGNGTINSVDFKTFRTVFGLSGPSIFDSNGDNRVDANDFADFRLRFGLMI